MPSPTDTLPSSVPKLDASGLNWAVFSLRFQDAIEAKDYWGHFDGMSKCPIMPKPEDLPVTPETATAPVADAPIPAADMTVERLRLNLPFSHGFISVQNIILASLNHTSIGTVSVNGYL